MAVVCAQRTEAPIPAVGGAFRVAAPPDHQVPSEEGPTGGFRRRIFLDDFFIGIELAPCHSTAEEAFFSITPSACALCLACFGGSSLAAIGP